MSFIHYLFLGHFEHDGDAVRFSKSPIDSVYRPVVRRPLDTAAVKAVLRESIGAETEDLDFPEDWMMWQDDGYLVCDKYTRNRKAIDFVARLVERTGCDIYDASAHSLTLAGRPRNNIAAREAPDSLLSDAQLTELQRRVADAEAHPEDYVSWTDALANTLKRLAR